MAAFEHFVRWVSSDGPLEAGLSGNCIRLVASDGQFLELTTRSWLEVSQAVQVLVSKNKQLAGQKSLPQNAGKPWSRPLDEELRTLWLTQKDFTVLATHFKRTRGAIKARLERLGLVEHD